MYASDLATKFTQNRESYNETDVELVKALESVGIQDKVMIDIGCGDGRHARLFKKMGAGQVTGYDASEPMIELAKKNNGVEGVFFETADGRHLPVADKTADIVISNYVIHHFDDAREIFGEIGRVVKEGGYFVGAFNITDAAKGHEHLYNTVMPIRLGSETSWVMVHDHIKPRQEIENAIAEAGLVIKEEQELDHHNAVIDDAFPDKPFLVKHAVLMVLQKTTVTN